MSYHATIATNVEISEESLVVDLEDGRTVSVPLAWYPRLLHASAEERGNWRFIGRGEGIHWPDLDEDISIENILVGQASGESQQSFRQWLEARQGHAPGRAGYPAGIRNVPGAGFLTVLCASVDTLMSGIV